MNIRIFALLILLLASISLVPSAFAQNESALTLDKISDVAEYSGAGEIITYSYLVSSTGNAPVIGPITVADDKVTVSCPAVDTVGNGDGNLDPGEQIVCTATHAVVADDITAGFITNVATASGIDQTDSIEDIVTVNYLPPGTPFSEPIPTLSEWSRMLLSFLFLLMGVAYLRRKQVV